MGNEYVQAGSKTHLFMEAFLVILNILNMEYSTIEMTIIIIVIITVIITVICNSILLLLLLLLLPLLLLLLLL